VLRSSGDTRDQHLFEDWQSEFQYPSTHHEQAQEAGRGN
jgi:hypothetical protein